MVVKIIWWEKNNLQELVLGQLDAKEWSRTLYTKIDSKLVKELNLSTKLYLNINILEENIGINLNYLGFGNGFSAKTSKAQAKEEK